MVPGQPSRTALAAAAHRAAHQLLEGGALFTDPLAVRILGRPASDIVAGPRAGARSAPMRRFVCARATLAETAVAKAVETGLRQVVILGAGLDTFAYRHGHGPALQVFEVDYPATGAWKRERLAAAGIFPVAAPVYVAVDFERDDLAERLASAGLDASRPAFFVWLGVVPYLTQSAIFATLQMVAARGAGASIVFDYGEPPHTRSPRSRAWHAARAAAVAALGEPWITYFEPAPLRARLEAMGFDRVTDIDDPVRRVAAGAASFLKVGRRGGGHVLIASIA